MNYDGHVIVAHIPDIFFLFVFLYSIFKVICLMHETINMPHNIQ